jgi:hypothetical protein
MRNRRCELFEYRQVPVRMRQGDSDREIAKAGLMGRRKAAELRAVALEQGWLGQACPLPADGALAAVLSDGGPAPGPAAQVEPLRERIQAWRQAGITGTTIHRVLVREHGFAGSYAAIRRFLGGLEGTEPQATVRLAFAPGAAAQVDFGGRGLRSWPRPAGRGARSGSSS